MNVSVFIYFISSNYYQQMVEKPQCTRKEVTREGQNKDKVKLKQEGRVKNRFSECSREEAPVVKTLF